MYGSGVPVVKLGRMAGQFAKPRSEDLETIDGVSLPSYRGDNINRCEFTPEARRPDPSRLVKAYDQSCATLNLLRAFSNGGYAAMTRVSDWNLDFMENTERGSQYEDLAQRVDAAIDFMAACGIDETHPSMQETSFFTAHEALHLGYEESLTRLDSTTEEHYGCSAHFLWCGERTRQPEGAHMEYFRGISNPIGIKISDKSDGEGVVSLVKKLNPDNVPGRITLISRMGAAKLREHLPRLITAIEDAGLNVLWVTDPMHGNTIKTDNGFKTRPFEAVRDEIMAFFEVHEKMGTYPGGVHLEMTGQNVTECTGGIMDVSVSDLEKRYLTHCDPRLNASQAIELAFLMASELNDMRRRRAAQ
jgi:3-deoxy-7-phosphoheptulonate synthase